MNIIQHPSVILIIGRRRFGKSALAHYIGEKFHKEKPELKIFIVCLPKEKQELLPDWLIPVDNVEELPDNCVAIIDEGSFKYHAHKWQKKETEVMDRMISISGQRKQTYIFITHTMRKFAVAILLDINILMVKKPSLLQMKLERSQFRKLIEEIDQEFNKLPKDDVKKSVYVVSDDYKGMIRNPLPSYWSEDLSEAYAGIGLSKDKKEEDEEPVEDFKPMRIESGLKIWFKEEDTKNVFEIFNQYSNLDGELSTMGIICTAEYCHYDWDLKLGSDEKYHLSNNKFDMAKIIEKLEENNIKVMIDTESAFPICDDDLNFEKDIPKKQIKKDNLIEFANNKVKL